eukprot:1589558-Rhodomonas_salina.3
MPDWLCIAVFVSRVSRFFLRSRIPARPLIPRGRARYVRDEAEASSCPLPRARTEQVVSAARRLQSLELEPEVCRHLYEEFGPKATPTVTQPVETANGGCVDAFVWICARATDAGMRHGSGGVAAADTCSSCTGPCASASPPTT